MFIAFIYQLLRMLDNHVDVTFVLTAVL